MFLNSVSFADADNGITGGLNGVIMHTTDGGATWEPDESNTGAMVRGIYLTDANTGYAVGENGMILRKWVISFLLKWFLLQEKLMVRQFS